MKNNVNRKNINVDKQNIIPLWNFKQEDDAILKLALYKGAIPFDITGQTIVLGAKRPNNSVVEQTDGFTINGNEIDIALKNNILAVNGLVELDLQITDVNGKLTTASFFITVAKKVLGENNLNASNDISAINQLVADLQAKTEEVNNAISTIEPKANQLMNDIQTDYNSLQKIIIDENQAANLQGQITDLGSQLDTKTTNIISTKAFSTLQQTINKATELGINKVYVDRDFDEEITLYSNIELLSNGNTIKKIIANGNRGNTISHSGVNKNYINTSQLQSGDIIIIDLNVGGLNGQGKYREINKVLYVDNNKAYLENETLFEYSINTRVIKINTVKNIKLTNIKVLDFNFNICEDIVFNDVTLLHSGSIAMCYKITANVLKVKSQKDNESRLDIFSCSRDITFNTLISEGGNTESDNSNIKLNQVANVNIDNLILKSAYKPKNVYGYDGYFHNFMIDGAISELIDFIGDDVAYPNYPSKHININNVILNGGANTYHSIFLTVVEDVNINNLINIKTLALKELKNIRINNLSVDTLHFDGN